MSNLCAIGNTAKGCQIVQAAGYPYECAAKDKYPSHLVFVCLVHNSWYHKAS